MVKENAPKTFIVNGKEVPLRTPEEAKSETEAQKAELDKQLADGLIDSATYNQKLISLRVPDEYKAKPHKKFRLRYLIIPLGIVFICWSMLLDCLNLYLDREKHPAVRYGLRTFKRSYR